MQCLLSVLLFMNDIDQPHTIPLSICQLGSSCSCYHQFVTGKPFNFIVRAFFSMVRVFLAVHTSVCGRRWPDEGCDSQGWSDERLPFRVLHLFAALRMGLNALSLVMHYWHPKSGIASYHGHEQLYYRGIVRGLGVPLHLLRGSLKEALLEDTAYARSDLEKLVNFVRGAIIIPISTWSLINQYWDTGKKSSAPSCHPPTPVLVDDGADRTDFQSIPFYASLDTSLGASPGGGYTPNRAKAAGKELAL